MTNVNPSTTNVSFHIVELATNDDGAPAGGILAVVLGMPSGLSAHPIIRRAPAIFIGIGMPNTKQRPSDRRSARLLIDEIESGK